MRPLRPQHLPPALRVPAGTQTPKQGGAQGATPTPTVKVQQ